MAIYSWFTYKRWWFSIAVAAIAMFVYLRDKCSIAMFDPQGIYIYNISQPLLLVRLFEQALWDFLSQPTISLGTSFLKHTGNNTNKNDYSNYQHNLGGIILDLAWWPKKHISWISNIHEYTKAGTLLLHDIHIHVTKVSEGIFNIMGEGIASDMFIDVNNGQF